MLGQWKRPAPAGRGELEGISEMQDGWLLTLTCCGWERIERRWMTYEELFQYYLVTGARGAPKSPVREQLEESRRPYGAEDTKSVPICAAHPCRPWPSLDRVGCWAVILSIQKTRVGTVFSNR